MKTSEIKELSLEDLKDKIAEKEAALSKLTLSHSIAAIENPMSIRNTRRDVARLKTALNAKKNNG